MTCIWFCIKINCFFDEYQDFANFFQKLIFFLQLQEEAKAIINIDTNTYHHFVKNPKNHIIANKDVNEMIFVSFWTHRTGANKDIYGKS